MDFLSSPIATALSERSSLLSEKGFRFVITPEYDVSGGDVVVAPDAELGASPTGTAIENIIMQHDSCSDIFSFGPACERSMQFFSLLKDMKLGRQGIGQFTRTNNDGWLETLRIGYTPVVVPGFRPVDSSEFSRGIEEYETTLYSVGVVELDKEVLQKFDFVGGAIEASSFQASAVLVFFVFVSFLVVLVISANLSKSVSIPVTQLLDVVTSINR